MSQTPDELLNDMLGPDVAGATAPPAYDQWGEEIPPPNPHLLSATNTKAEKMTSSNISQWAIGGNGFFVPTATTLASIPAGVYTPVAPMNSPVGLQHMPINSDGIYRLPDMATEIVLKEVESFWNNEALYRKHHLLYKRGILLWGPPGSGKTITVKILMQELIKRDGLVVICQHVGTTGKILKDLRQLEPTRKIIVVFEDIDEIINYNGEAQVLSLLDGEHNIDNVLNLATTNFPDRLGARICNRPSRFDRRVYVGMPEAEARKEYLRLATHNGLDTTQLEQWTADSKNMSLAHMRELVAAVYCLNQPYDEVIKRLKAMAEPPRVKEDGFAKSKTRGFSNVSSDEKMYESGQG